MRPSERPARAPYAVFAAPSQGGGASLISAEASSFLARTTGLNVLHTNGYVTLINSLVYSGIWALLDVFYVTATQDSTTACLNLISSSFTLTPTASPTFAADRGYTGDGVGAYLATGFTPSTQSTKAAQDNVGVFAWSRTAGQIAGALFGDSAAGVNTRLNLYPRYTDDTLYGRLNSSSDFSQASTDGSGLWATSRIAAGTALVYRNGAAFSTETNTSSAMASSALRLLSDANAPSGAMQIAAFGYGSNLTAAQQAVLYSALNGWMTLVGAA